MWCLSSIFFFQAEDGIRDLTVTGVQTCALPISCRPAGAPSRDPEKVRQLVDKYLLPHFDTQYSATLVLGRHWRAATPERSEERRVGKEGRSAGSPEHEKKIFTVRNLRTPPPHAE